MMTTKHDEQYHEGDSPLLNMKMTFSRSQTTPEDKGRQSRRRHAFATNTHE